MPRSARIDALKGAAVVAVVGLHALATGVADLARLLPATIGALLSAAVPLFMATSVFLAAREGDVRRAVTRRLPRLLVPYATATAVYAVAAIALGGVERATFESRSALDVALWGGAWYHLYFLPALAQLLLLLPLLRLAVATPRRAAAAFAGAVALVAPGPWLERPVAPLDLRWALVWLPAAVAGAALAAGTLRVRRPGVWLAAGAGVTIAEALAARHGAGPALAYARVGLPLLATGALAGSLRPARTVRPGRALRPLAAIGRRSLGVYLLHPLFLVASAHLLAPYPLAAAVPVTAAATALAWVATAALARTPLAPVVGAGWAGPATPVVEPSPVVRTGGAG